jgi:RimJ/RimL family protein N-acetyltransferase
VAKNIALGGVSFTMFADGKVVGCVGGIKWMPGVWGIWALLSEDIKRHGLSYHRTMLRFLKKAMGDHDIRRIQVLVDVGNEVALKQNEAWGFKREGILRASGANGEDQWILSIVKGDL